LQAPGRLETVQPRKLDVHHDEVESLDVQDVERLLRRRHLAHLIALRPKQELSQAAIHHVVLHQQDFCAGHLSPPQSLRAIGSVKKNRLPLPGSLSTQRLPPCISTNFLASAKPRPVPSGLSALPSLLTCWNSRKIRS